MAQIADMYPAKQLTTLKLIPWRAGEQAPLLCVKEHSLEEASGS